jgi:hypothetical protein
MRWSLDFVYQFAAVHILNIVDDVTRECSAAIPDFRSWDDVWRTNWRRSNSAASGE